MQEYEYRAYRLAMQNEIEGFYNVLVDVTSGYAITAELNSDCPMYWLMRYSQVKEYWTDMCYSEDIEELRDFICTSCLETLERLKGIALDFYGNNAYYEMTDMIDSVMEEEEYE